MLLSAGRTGLSQALFFLAAGAFAIRPALPGRRIEAQRNWSGRDLKEFESWWRDQHRPKLVQLSEALAGLGQAAFNNAAEQEQASQGSAASGSLAGGSVSPSGPAFGAAYNSFKGQTDAVSKTMDYATLGMILKYGDKAVDGLDRGTAWGPFTKGLGYVGILTGGIETVQGIASHDVGKAGGGLVDVGLATAGIVGGTAAAPVVIPLGVAKTFVDATIPYSDEAQNSLLDYQAKRMYGCDTSALTPAQASHLTARYEGGWGVVNMISDKMDQTGQPIADAGEAFRRWLGART
nr:hypothetical protein [Propionibacterium sp.]